MWTRNTNLIKALKLSVTYRCLSVSLVLLLKRFKASSRYVIASNVKLRAIPSAPAEQSASNTLKFQSFILIQF